MWKSFFPPYCYDYSWTSDIINLFSVLQDISYSRCLGHCARSFSLLSFLFLLSALWTCVKHLTSQKNSARKQKKTWPPSYPPTPDNNCWILHSIYSRLCFPCKYFSPSRSKSAKVRQSAETPPYAAIETVHSSLLSFAGYSEQLLQTAPFLYLTLLFGERQRGPQRASHTFLTLAPPLDCCPFLRGCVRCLMSTAPRDNGPLDLWPQWGKGKLNLMLRSSTTIV